MKLKKYYNYLLTGGSTTSTKSTESDKTDNESKSTFSKLTANNLKTFNETKLKETKESEEDIKTEVEYEVPDSESVTSAASSLTASSKSKSKSIKTVTTEGTIGKKKIVPVDSPVIFPDNKNYIIDKNGFSFSFYLPEPKKSEEEEVEVDVPIAELPEESTPKDVLIKNFLQGIKDEKIKYLILKYLSELDVETYKSLGETISEIDFAKAEPFLKELEDVFTNTNTKSISSNNPAQDVVKKSVEVKNTKVDLYGITTQDLSVSGLIIKVPFTLSMQKSHHQLGTNGMFNTKTFQSKEFQQFSSIFSDKSIYKQGFGVKDESKLTGFQNTIDPRHKTVKDGWFGLSEDWWKKNGYFSKKYSLATEKFECETVAPTDEELYYYFWFMLYNIGKSFGENEYILPNAESATFRDFHQLIYAGQINGNSTIPDGSIWLNENGYFVDSNKNQYDAVGLAKTESRLIFLFEERGPFGIVGTFNSFFGGGVKFPESIELEGGGKFICNYDKCKHWEDKVRFVANKTNQTRRFAINYLEKDWHASGGFIGENLSNLDNFLYNCNSYCGTNFI